MTRKHFEAIANAIRINRVFATDDEQILLNDLACDLAAEFARFNPNFDRDKFIEATKVKPTTSR